MGFEGGRSRWYETPRPRTAETRIEGEVVKSFSEIDIDQGVHIPLFDITWQTAKLRFARVGTYNMPQRYGLSSPIDLYTAKFEYRAKSGRKRKRNLSLLTSQEKPVLFTGTRNGFYAHDPLMKGYNAPFYVVGIQPYELLAQMSELSAIWHELGHVGIFHTNADLDLLKAAITLRGENLPNAANALLYGQALANALPKAVRETPPAIDRNSLTQLQAKHHDVNVAVRLFHERNAWAGGMYLARDQEFPTGFQHPRSYFEYARLCLSTYEDAYHERRFVKGWHGTKRRK